MAQEEMKVMIKFMQTVEAAAGDAAHDLLDLLSKSAPDPGPNPGPDPDPTPLPDPVDPEPDPDTTPPVFKKRYFHIIDHHNMPARPAGLEPLKIWYEGAFFNEGRIRTNAGFSVQGVGFKSSDAAGNSPLISCPDIERWAHKDTWRVPEENVKRYITFCKDYRANLPSSDHKFGLYSILPVRNYFDAVGGKGPAGFVKWQTWNDEVAPIAEHVDMLFPSLYTFSSVFQDASDRLQEWEIYAVANIQEARRIAPGKPVYPFIWPWYHPSARKAIDADFWRRQMDICAEHADGFVIWDDLSRDKTQWANVEKMGWWKETEEFMRGR